MTNNQIYNYLDFAKSLEEAKQRAKSYRFKDPFKEDISPALLNKTDIAKYVAKTGMIYPFDPNKLKPASYEVKFGNEVLYWDEKSEKRHLKDLKPKDSIKIRQNSITYVGVETKFILPLYIALRFNLIITHVHRGLLLGTGPLIDPGFDGLLMIPIHNLTTNDYIFRPGDDLIAVEFTKLSPDNILEDDNSLIEKQKYDKNVKKPALTFNNYIENAIKPLTSVESSLEQTIGKAKEEVEKVRKESSRTARIITWAGIAIAATLVITSLTVFFQTNSLITDANKYVSDSTTSISNKFDGINELISKQKDSMVELKTHINTLSTDLNSKLDDTDNKLKKLKNDLERFETGLKKIEQKIHKKTQVIHIE
jgi:deoxycytidine triphosphate deaminase/cell division protein FtsL